MRIGARSSLILLATFLFGLAIGALGVGALSHRRGEHLRELRYPGGFVQYMERIIRPRDEAQREAIRPILEEADRRNWTLMDSTHTRLMMEMESLRERLGPHLDEDQRQRLETQFDEFGHPHRGGHGRRGHERG